MKLFPITLLLTAILISPSIVSGQSATHELFRIDSDIVAKQALPEHEMERRYLQLNREILESDQLAESDKLSVSIEGEPKLFEITRITGYLTNSLSVVAKGEESGELLIANIGKDRIFGKIHTSQYGTLYHLDFDRSAGKPYLARINPQKLDKLSCSVDENITAPVSDHNHGFAKTGTSTYDAHSPNLSAMASTLEDDVTIDLMIVYTPAAKAWADGSSGPGSIEAVIEDAMILSQAALDESEVQINLRLVHTYEVDYDEENDGLEETVDRLRRLTASPLYNPYGSEYEGYMEEVHDLRDQYGADLVAMFALIEDTGGIAWRGSDPGGNPNIGFSVNRVQQVGGTYTLIHEIGHNMGNAHARNQNEAAAGVNGGIFEYSTGYRWTDIVNGQEKSFATIMAYPDGYETAPIFSSPELEWQGSSAGSYTASSGPSDNARSMRESKWAIANFRNTQVDPPAITVSDNSIEITMNQEDTHQLPITISNNGDSDLMWDVDFEPGTLVSKQHSKTTTNHALTVDYIDWESASEMESPIPASAVFAASNSSDPVLLNTTFSSEEGFDTGSFSATQEWKTFSESMTFDISSDNPGSGSNHMRISKISSDGWVFIQSPYFGPQPYGAYEFSVDLSFENFSSSGGTDDHFYIVLFDSRLGMQSAEILFRSDSQIFYRDLNEEGQPSYPWSGHQFSTNGYNNLVISFNPDDQEIQFIYDGTEIASTSYFEGRKPDYFWFIYQNEVPGNQIDIDNIQVTRSYDPFQWLNLDRFGGVVEPDGNGDLLLTFSTIDVDSGEYTADLILNSNDPTVSSLTIPLKLNVSTSVSTEVTDILPERMTLNQNYPNPFNPTTNITFTVPEAGEVFLEVYDMLGRKVTSLLEEQVEAGEHNIKFDASGLSSGVYIYRLTSGQKTLNRQMVLIK